MLAKQMDISHIIVESDSVVLINLLHSPEVELHPLGTIILNCQHLISSFIVCNVVHIYRERNMAEDFLAKKSIDQEIGICKLHYVPEFVAPTILDDIAGLAHSRLISAASAAS